MVMVVSVHSVRTSTHYTHRLIPCHQLLPGSSQDLQFGLKLRNDGASVSDIMADIGKPQCVCLDDVVNVGDNCRACLRHMGYISNDGTVVRNILTDVSNDGASVRSTRGHRDDHICV